MFEVLVGSEAQVCVFNTSLCPDKSRDLGIYVDMEKRKGTQAAIATSVRNE